MRWFKVLPDYGIDNIPTDLAGIVLIGGMSWFTPETEAIVPLVKDAIENRKLVAGICNASVFPWNARFSKQDKAHQQRIGYLKAYAGANYTGENFYIDRSSSQK